MATVGVGVVAGRADRGRRRSQTRPAMTSSTARQAAPTAWRATVKLSGET